MAGGKDNGGKTMENRGKGITMTNNRSLVSLMSSYLISDSYIENSCISKDLTNNNEKWNNKNSSNLDKHINNIDSNNINNSAKNNSVNQLIQYIIFKVG